MKKEDLSIVVKTQEKFIKDLLDRLECKNIGKSLSIEDIETNDLICEMGGSYFSISYIKQLLADEYFKGLGIDTVFDLAKKSIRLTEYNCELAYKLNCIMEILDNSKLADKIKDIIVVDK